MITIAPAEAQGTPIVGSTQPATADPPVTRPATRPIRVPLFANVKFDSFDAHPFEFTPPAKGKWAKIVFVGDFHCTAGVQYDRTCTVFLGNVNIFFGTTAEPGAKTAPSWHVERDLTDYAALFTAARAGNVSLGNIVNKQLTGVLSGSAYLLFYPAAKGAPAAAPADFVFPLNSQNGAISLPDAKSTLAATFTFPTNTVRVYLDLILQGQGGDEFWYLSVPDSVKEELQSSGGTAFREGEVAIDGKPAGIAPIFPWIFTGGIDPLWWRPIPGIQTLNLAPWRVDLTPFAGMLDERRPHTVSVRVLNDSGSFSTCGALLVYTDPHATRVTGKLVEDTLSAPVPQVSTSLHKSALGEIGGPVSLTAHRKLVIDGWVETSRGLVETRVEEDFTFTNRQTYVLTPAKQSVDLAQDQRIKVHTMTHGRGSKSESIADTDWPLAMHLADPASVIAGARAEHTVDQGIRRIEVVVKERRPFTSTLSDMLWSQDTVVFGGQGRRANRSPGSWQSYDYADSAGGHWSRIVATRNLKVTAVVTSPPIPSK